LYVKVDKYKREYHAATKNVKMAETQENNSKLDGSITQEQVKQIILLFFWIRKKNNSFHFSVRKPKKNSNDLVRKKKPRKSNIPKLFKNLIELIQNIWMI
jgi:hypothetical protein